MLYNDDDDDDDDVVQNCVAVSKLWKKQCFCGQVIYLFTFLCSVQE
jgi:hypothetical protein